MSREKSEIKYLHNKIHKQIDNGKIVIDEEYVRDGDKKGLSVKYYHKENDKVLKIVVYVKDNEYHIKKTEDNQTDDVVVDKKNLIKELKKLGLNFALKYIESMKGGARKNSRKSSRKSIRKVSRKRKSSRKSQKKH